MTAPDVGFSAECQKGLDGDTFITVDPVKGDVIEITLSPLDGTGLASRERRLTVTHNEARDIIAGLASVIT